MNYEKTQESKITRRRRVRKKVHHPGTKQARKMLQLYGRNLTVCEVCGAVGPSITIHHKNMNPYDNKIENLIVLCSRCHAKVHGYVGEDEVFVEDLYYVIEDEADIPEVPEIDDSTITIELPDERAHKKPLPTAKRIHDNRVRAFPKPQVYYPSIKGWQCRLCKY